MPDPLPAPAQTAPGARYGRAAVARLRRRWRHRTDGRSVTVVTSSGVPLTWIRDHRYPAAFADGSYEPELLAELARRLEPGGTFLDLGANAGFVSFVAKTLVGSGGRVLAVEPLPANVAMIRRVQDRNPGLPVELTVGAVGATSAPITLEVTTNTANSRIDGASWSLEKPAVDRITVDAHTLDDLMAEARPTLVKMDIEGAEQLVLEASGGPTAWGARPALLVEYHGPANRAVCERRAREWGYQASTRPSADLPDDSGLVVFEP